MGVGAKMSPGITLVYHFFGVAGAQGPLYAMCGGKLTIVACH